MWRKLLMVLSVCSATAHAQLPNLGREATPAEIAAWNIDVRADFKGLPKGSGSAVKGAVIWDAQCASCHGTFGESNAVFPPLVGGTTQADRVKGRVAAMTDGSSPYRTTLMKTSQLSTLWDYINRAMPWNAPKSLSTNDVYAVTAYLLNLGDIVADDFVLSDQNIASVQATLPNRNGKTTQHGLWHVNGKPDTQNTACMVNCGAGKVVSTMPDYAQDAHGNLADQNRTFGPYRGIDTSQARITKALAPAALAASAPLAPAAAAPIAIATSVAVTAPTIAPTTAPTTAPTAAVNTSVSSKPLAASVAPASAVPTAAPTPTPTAAKPLVDIRPLLAKHTCTACHGINNKILGPSFADIAKKHAGKTDYLTDKVKNGGQGVWGAVPMPAQTLPLADAKAIGAWLANGLK